jgi:uncharacterized membrane protein
MFTAKCFKNRGIGTCVSAITAIDITTVSSSLITIIFFFVCVFVAVLVAATCTIFIEIDKNKMLLCSTHLMVNIADLVRSRGDDFDKIGTI